MIDLHAALYWTLWLALFFLPAELYAAFRTPRVADTFSEFCWWTFDKTWKRLIGVAFLEFLMAHLMFQWTVIPVVVLGVPVGWVIVSKMMGVTMPQYSFVKTLGKVWQTLLEIVTAIAISVLPQLFTVLLDLLGNLPPEQIHIPAQWAALWLLVIRGASNWWKNRNK